ncbi:hypothetical protein [Deinococcus sp. QL22]|uniref:hypothetical protein n=1 Tax=Deinococcus sp. QL22 TaxID=2939437 RepID=UPI002017667C|nr:hypothetical protein [Deinococcus sp. QL22]UQN05244.1 hypothetical protein M1R55_10120 [Deinococcus sp. QL22]
MSRAFVKEDSGERWTPPTAPAQYRIVLPTDHGPEVLRETDDLLTALQRLQAGLELRDRQGILIARG